MEGNNEHVGGDDLRNRNTNSNKLNSEDSQPSSSTGGASCSNDSSQNELLSTNSEYCKQLENWLWKCYWHRTIAVSAYFTVLNQYYGSSTSSNETIPPGQTPPYPPQPQPRQPHIPGFRINFNLFANLNNLQGRSSGDPLILVKVAPIWKRLVAEVIDFIILMILKIVVTFAIIDNFDVIDFDNIDLTSFQNQDAELRFSSLYDLAFTISSELIILETIHRMLACIVEAFCLSKYGCTPGKSLLNLRAIHVESIVPHPGNQAADVQFVLVSPASYLTFPRAFFRSIVKNFSLAFFFPLCFTLFHFDYSRTMYDLVGKSLVVENY